MQVRRNVRWIIALGATSLVLFILLSLLLRHGGKSLPVSRSPIEANLNHQKYPVSQGPAVASNKPVVKEEPLSEPPMQEVPPLDERALEVHRRAADELNAREREATKRLYAGVFQQLRLPADLQEKVIDILTQEEKQLEQRAFEAARSGTLPVFPSPEEARAQQAQQEQQLRSVLGNADFAQFNQYQTTIPDRSTIDIMNQQGANLSESQSQQLLQVLTDARRQIIGEAGITQNFDSMPPEQTVTVMREQQDLLKQTVDNRVQNLLTPEQATLLKHIMSQQIIPGP